MNEHHPLNFAVVREDPCPEVDCIQKNQGKKVLLVASGGCTAFTLKDKFPDITIDLFDINPAQIQHIKDKITAIREKNYSLLNIEDNHSSGLSQNGVFERHFRIFRQIFIEFISSKNEIELFFRSEFPIRKKMLSKWKNSSFWKLAFKTCFNNEFLSALFGPKAVQHAKENSFIEYFMKRFEVALGKEESADNYFLQSIFLGYYLAGSAPSFLTSESEYDFNFYCSALPDLDEIDQYDLISLSNIFDWCDKETINTHISILSNMKPGGTLVLRQLNNPNSLRPLMEPGFRFNDEASKYYQINDRSMFYNRIEIATKIQASSW